MRTLLLSALLTLPAASMAARMEYLTIGPMIHWNFGDNRFIKASWGLEAAYWNFDRDGFEKLGRNPIPGFGKRGYGLTLGLEKDRDAVRFYSEPQVGWVFAGMALGPVLEVDLHGGPAAWGIQGSFWVNPLVGLDFRYRRLAGRHNQAFGLYGKAVAVLSGPEIPPAEDF